MTQVVDLAVSASLIDVEESFLPVAQMRQVSQGHRLRGRAHRGRGGPRSAPLGVAAALSR